jgi:NADP-dependent aldehyde dehydrogenase
MTVVSHDPRTGGPVTSVEETPPDGVRSVVAAAAGAAPAAAAAAPTERRAWLYAVADALEAHRDELVALAEQETALGATRLTGEVDRTAGQLRFYGDVAVEGSYLGVTVDSATGSNPRLVRANRPLGPVAVFGASNFPFAFSVLGNDTGAALAAGCPVVAKAHEAHAGLSLRQTEIAAAALDGAGAPTGVLGTVVGTQAGVDLVRDPGISAVAFTGSQAGGLALWRIANGRDVVVPVFAEMGTVNPVVVTRAGATDVAEVASGLVGSMTLGHGQFCTKPGLLLAPAGAGVADAVAVALRAADPHPVMLTSGIASALAQGVEEMRAAGAELVTRLEPGSAGWAGCAAVLRAPLDALRPGSRLLEECFGPVVLVCEYGDDEDLARALDALQPSLAASLVTGGPDDSEAPGLLRRLGAQVGRVVVDGWPTGVAVAWAQHHGGPWPATTVPAATSVGAAALARFVRPVAYQSAPDAWLPPEAQDRNPWGLPRRVDGQLETPAAGEA